MRRVRLALLIVAIAVTAACGRFCGRQPAPAPVPPTSSAERTRCIEAIAPQAAEWKRQNLGTDDIQRRYQAAVAACAGAAPTPAVGACYGAVNWDYARLGLQFRTEKLSPGEYLARVWDRSRKRQHCADDSGFADNLAKGDADGDLIPDASDACAGTADLAPTTDNGCPAATSSVAGAPSVEDVRKAFTTFGFVASPACETAPPPNVPTPVRLTIMLPRAPFDKRLTVEVTPVVNQPAGCHVFYEVSVRGAGTPRPGATETDYARFVFRDTDAKPSSSGIELERVLTGNDALFLHNTFEWRVRTMNGAGTASGWSQTGTGVLAVQ